jgi:putative heme transporter
VWTIIGHLSLFLVLLLALREVGVSEEEVGWAEALTVFAFARLLTAIPITPGGLGVIELALITGLKTAGGEGAQIVAAVLIFRALTFILPIPLGLGTYIYWRRNRSWRNSAPPLPEMELRPS